MSSVRTPLTPLVYQCMFFQRMRRRGSFGCALLEDIETVSFWPRHPRCVPCTLNRSVIRSLDGAASLPKAKPNQWKCETAEQTACALLDQSKGNAQQQRCNQRHEHLYYTTSDFIFRDDVSKDWTWDPFHKLLPVEIMWGHFLCCWKTVLTLNMPFPVSLVSLSSQQYRLYGQLS